MQDNSEIYFDLATYNSRSPNRPLRQIAMAPPAKRPLETRTTHRERHANTDEFHFFEQNVECPLVKWNKACTLTAIGRHRAA